MQREGPGGGQPSIAKTISMLRDFATMEDAKNPSPQIVRPTQRQYRKGERTLNQQVVESHSVEVPT